MDNKFQENLRNIAIIAHIDHGKTTLVDGLLRQSGIFRDNEVVSERIMDSNELEKERGITILAKNTAVNFKDYKINIVDTPGHADFGGEVERVLQMTDGALLLVDALEGPMAQTKFVLRKALEKNLRIIVVINKIDRPEARPDEVLNEVFDLFVELEAQDWQLDFPVVYTNAKEGTANMDYNQRGQNLQPLFELICREIPPPQGEREKTLQLQINSLDYNDYVGRIGIGRIKNGTIRSGDNIALCKNNGKLETHTVTRLWTFSGLTRKDTEFASTGDIIAIAGLGKINIGETVTDSVDPSPLSFTKIDEPTMTINILVNNSPFSGHDGEYLTSRQLQKRIYREAETNVSLIVTPTDSPEVFEVSGRGELHLGIFLETLRREGYEFQISQPKPLLKTIDGKVCEPFEHLFINLPEDFSGRIIELIGERGGELINMKPAGEGKNVKLEFIIPSRGLIGFRSELLTETSGEGVMAHLFDRYGPLKGKINGRRRGALIAFETGEATTFGLHGAEKRGSLFIRPGERVYAGMIIGINSREQDLEVNVCKTKHLTNHRASGAEDALRLAPPQQMNLEQAMVFISADELAEITPKKIRLRKKILDSNSRRRKKFS